MSGCAFDKPGWITLSTYFRSNNTGVFSGMVMAVEAKPTGARFYRLAHNQALYDVPGEAYFNETHATVNRDFTRVAFISDMRNNAYPSESYQICLPSWGIPEST